MNINNQDIDINDLISQKYMHKELKKGIYLSEYQIEVLTRYQINPNECSSINDLLLRIEEILEEDPDADDLDQISQEIAEFSYYANTNK